MNLSDAIEGYLLFKATRASPETIKTDTVMLRQFLQWRAVCDVKEVTADDVRRYLAYHLGRGLSRHTVRRHLAVVASLYAWLVSPEVALAEVNPARAVPAPKLPQQKIKSLTHDQITALVAATDHTRLKRRNRAIVLFLLDTGARASETAGVRLADVDFQSGRVRVEGKGKKQRYVYLGKRALSALWLYVKEERPDPAQVGDDHLFLSNDGYPFSRRTVRSVCGSLGRLAGFHVYPHQFRHTAAIEHLRHGMDLVSVQHLLGHESIDVTQGYLAALSDEDVEERAKRTSPGDNWRL